MLVLQETPAGFALFKVDDAKLKKADTEVGYSCAFPKSHRRGSSSALRRI